LRWDIARKRDSGYGPRRTTLDDMTGTHPQDGMPFVKTVSTDGVETIRPNSPDAVDAVINVVSNPKDNIRTGTNLTPEQAEYLTRQDVQNKLTEVARRQQELSTTNITKLSEQELQRVLKEQDPMQIGDIVTILPTKGSTRAKKLMAKSNLNYADQTDMQKAVNEQFIAIKEGLKRTGSDVTDEEGLKRQLYLQELKKRCK